MSVKHENSHCLLIFTQNFDNTSENNWFIHSVCGLSNSVKRESRNSCYFDINKKTFHNLMEDEKYIFQNFYENNWIWWWNWWHKDEQQTYDWNLIIFTDLDWEETLKFYLFWYFMYLKNFQCDRKGRFTLKIFEILETLQNMRFYFMKMKWKCGCIRLVIFSSFFWGW